MRAVNHYALSTRYANTFGLSQRIRLCREHSKILTDIVPREVSRSVVIGVLEARCCPVDT